MQSLVLHTSEFDRIYNLPVREPDITEEELREITNRYARPGANVMLKPIQAIALRDLEQAEGNDGGFCAWGVGHGKFLMSALAFTARPGTPRPLIAVPANLKIQTKRELVKQSRDWRIRQDIKVVSWELLSRKSGLRFLANYRPGGIAGDEAHAIKNVRSGRYRKLSRYLTWAREDQGQEVWFLALTASPLNRSIKEVAHIAKISMLEKSPFPRTYQEAEVWAAAIDEKVPEYGRAGAGALLTWYKGQQDEEEIVKARKAVQWRMKKTPNFTLTSGGSVDISLNIFAWDFKPSKAIEDSYVHLQKTWDTPGGEAVESPLAMWRHSQEIMCGFYSIWDPPPPREWADARRDWHTFVREVIKSRRAKGLFDGVDTPLDVANLVDQGQLPDTELRRWRQIKPTFVPNPVPKWFDMSVADAAAAWAKKHKGLVWCEYVAMGKALEERGIPYYGANDPRILDAKGPAAVSRKANFEGKNLQQWNKNLILSPPSSGYICEQLIGRTHRHGQDEDEVEVYLYLGSRAQAECFAQAQRDAMMHEQTTGSRQKLNVATYSDMPDPDFMEGPTWQEYKQ